MLQAAPEFAGAALPTAGETGASARKPSVREAAADFWLRFMLWHVERFPGLARRAGPVLLWWAWRASRYLRGNLRANAAWLLGPESSAQERTSLAQATLAHFIGFICELGRTRGLSRAELLAEIHSVVGEDRYRRARELRRGAILVTAHLGSFETAIAALREREPRVHVVFRRDPVAGFERLRAAQRRRLGVIEAPIDDGLEIWLRLRDALRRDEVVLLQGDRVMPGQKGRPVPFLGGHIMMPAGLVKLALASDAPIVPTFAPRAADGRVRIVLEEPIIVDPGAELVNGLHPAMLQLAGRIEHHVRAHPEQWLMVHRAWCEDDPAWVGTNAS